MKLLLCSASTDGIELAGGGSIMTNVDVRWLRKSAQEMVFKGLVRRERSLNRVLMINWLHNLKSESRFESRLSLCEHIVTCREIEVRASVVAEAVPEFSSFASHRMDLLAVSKALGWLANAAVNIASVEANELDVSKGVQDWVSIGIGELNRLIQLLDQSSLR